MSPYTIGSFPRAQHLDFPTEVKQCVDSMYQRMLIDKKTRKFLIPQYAWAARFYLLPKIHRPGNPGRPIVASNCAPTKNTCISRFAEFFLRPSVIQLPSYIRDTKDFIKPRLPPGCLWLTLDVSLTSRVGCIWTSHTRKELQLARCF